MAYKKIDIKKTIEDIDLSEEEVQDRDYIYKKIYFEFIDPYPYILNHSLPLVQIWYYFLYFILLFLSFLKLLIIKPIKTIKNFFVNKTVTKGVENNPDVCSMDENNECIDFEEDKEEDEYILKTISKYYSHRESVKTAKQLIELNYNIPFSKKLSNYFRIKLREEYIATKYPYLKNQVKIIFTVPKIVKDIIFLHEYIINKIKNVIISLKIKK